MKNTVVRLTVVVVATLTLIAWPAAQGAHAATGPRCYVDMDAPGPTHDGDSWGTAYTHLYEAMGDGYCQEIWVAEGWYTPDPSYGPTMSLYLNYDVEVYGGFAGGETDVGQRDWKNHVTIISGDIDGNDVNTDLNHIDETPDDIVCCNSYYVVRPNGSAAHPVLDTTVLDGFTITGGRADSSMGGGVLCAGNGAGNQCSPKFENLTIIGNRADLGSGGGMELSAITGGVSSPTIRNVVFKNNRARFGGALDMEASTGTINPTLTDVTFEGNYAEYHGGAIYADAYGGGNTNFTIARATFSGNSASMSGGAIINNAGAGTASPTLGNVTFSGNSSPGPGGWGGAMFNSASTGTSSPILRNVTFHGNTAAVGGAMYNSATGTGGISRPDLYNVILWGNTAPTSPQIHNATGSGSASVFIDYSVIESGCGAIPQADCGTGHHSSTDPMLLPLADNSGFVKTMAIASDSSSAINRGEPSVCGWAPVGAVDARGVARPQQDGCEAGAYEYTHFFSDMPMAGKEWMEPWVDRFYLQGITTGCGAAPLTYCPENPVTRAAMAVFILRRLEGTSYGPPPADHFFSDLPVAGKEWMEPWVDEFYRRGITTGCGTGPPRYCPENPVTRAAMAVFILRAMEGTSYTPPAASHYFSDLPVAGKEWMEPWVDEFYRRGITSGCGSAPLTYCPENPVTRAAMAVFIGRAFRYYPYYPP